MLGDRREGLPDGQLLSAVPPSRLSAPSVERNAGGLAEEIVRGGKRLYRLKQ